MENFKKKYLGDKAFYLMVLGVVLPIMIQNGITNFVSLLDNIMVGRVGTEQMSGVAIVNQLMFVFNLGAFGVISGAGIFGAQFYGCGKHDGVRHTFRFKLIAVFIVTLCACLLFYFAGENLISLYLHEEETTDPAALRAALHYGRQYLLVMLIGIPPFAVSQCYTSTLRECGETILPMKASMAAVGVNMCFNAVLIFGLLGFPRLGVVGAAIATVLARYVEMVIVVLYTHKHADLYPFIKGAYESLHIPGSLVSKILIKGTPLMANELLWAMGMAVMTQCYSLRGGGGVGAVIGQLAFQIAQRHDTVADAGQGVHRELGLQHQHIHAHQPQRNAAAQQPAPGQPALQQKACRRRKREQQQGFQFLFGCFLLPVAQRPAAAEKGCCQIGKPHQLRPPEQGAAPQPLRPGHLSRRHVGDLCSSAPGWLGEI